MEAESRSPADGTSGEQRSAPVPMLCQEVRLCRIECWRGYITSRFYVRTDRGRVLESKPFRWGHDGPPPQTKKARAAYDKLVARLTAEGWTLVAGGTPWFAATFERTAVVLQDTSDRRELAAAYVAPLAPPSPVRQIANPEAAVKGQVEPEGKAEPESVETLRAVATTETLSASTHAVQQVQHSQPTHTARVRRRPEKVQLQPHGNPVVPQGIQAKLYRPTTD